MVRHEKYADSPRRAYAGQIHNLGDSNTVIRVALMDSSFSTDRTSDAVWADVSADEITEADNDGYTAGGQEITSKQLTQSSYTTTFDGADVTWPNSFINAYYAVVYNDTPTDNTNKDLLTIIDFEGEEVSENGDFTISWDASGIFQVDTDSA